MMVYLLIMSYTILSDPTSSIYICPCYCWLCIQRSLHSFHDAEIMEQCHKLIGPSVAVCVRRLRRRSFTNANSELMRSMMDVLAG